MSLASLAAVACVSAALLMTELALTRILPPRWFGPVSQSILAAFAHVVGQLALAYVWLVPHAAVWYLLPLFAVVAWLFGLSNGLLCAHLLQRHEIGRDA